LFSVVIFLKFVVQEVLFSVALRHWHFTR